jgi:hypothetical protein
MSSLLFISMMHGETDIKFTSTLSCGNTNGRKEMKWFGLVNWRLIGLRIGM